VMGMSASQTVPQQQSSPYFGMQTQPAQPLNQIGDMSFAQPAVMPMQPRMSRDEFQRDYYARGNMTVGAPSFADQQINAAYDQYTGQAQPAQTAQPESSQDLLSRMNQARQAGLQVGPTPNQPPNPYAGMGTGQLQQMNEMIRMQQMQADAAMRNQVPWYMRPPGMNEQPSPYSSPSQPYQRQMPYQMPYRQPMYQMPYQMPMSRQRMPLNMFGGLGSLFGFMRR